MRNLLLFLTLAAPLVTLTLATSVPGAASTSPQIPSASDQKLTAAERSAASEPASFSRYNELAAALCKRAEATGDVRFANRASAAIRKSLELSPANFDARKWQSAVLLAQGDLAGALALATELHQKVPDDIDVWAILVDANVAIGDYPAAEHAAQWILDLRRDSGLGFRKAAVLRRIFGDDQGAAEFFEESFRRSSPEDFDGRAWLLTQIGDLQRRAGNAKAADVSLQKAMQAIPDFAPALAVLARVRALQADPAAAVKLLKTRYQAIPVAAHLYDLAKAVEANGEKQRALPLFQEFESKAHAQTAEKLNANRELIEFYADHQANPAKALALATQEAGIRHDVSTLDLYAWALFRSGQFPQAKTQIDRVLAVGTREPFFLCHAHAIEAATHGSTPSPETCGDDESSLGAGPQ